ncbi:MAG: flagellar motor switch protein FliN [Synergistaceae bacterium]|nr:flagellar motor switch protein FliN [Synergistaceae bacterium]
MVDEFLNQDEIDALLSGGEDSGGGGGSSLSSDDMSILNEVAGIIASSASNVIGMLAGRDVSAIVTEQKEVPQSTFAGTVDGPKVFSYYMQLEGLDSMPAQLISGERCALALADLMMGGDAKELPAEANDLYLSAAQEGLSQLIGSALTSLSGLMAGARLSAASSSANLDDTGGWLPFPSDPPEMTIWVGKINLTVDGVEPFMLDMVLSSNNAAALAAKVRAAMAPPEPEQPAAAAAPAPAPQQRQPQQQAAPAPAPQAPMSVSLPPRPQGPPVDVRPVEFAQLGGSDFAGSPGNIDLIVDIPVRVTVELGRTRKTIGEVLALGPGSVVELNKMAGEPVDVLVNGKLIARGEVVVIDESFGIRVTEVVSRAERIRSMGV